MANIMPEGEAIRRAVKWGSEQIKDNPEKSPQVFVNEAVMRFDLSPRDAEFLTNFYRSGNG